MADFGIYKGRVVNNNDPTNTGRMKLQVPQLFGAGLTNWALPAQHIRYSANIGDQVWVSFEGGDTSKPLWWGGEPDVTNQINTAETYAYNLANEAQNNAAGYADVLTRNNQALYTMSGSASISASTTAWTSLGFATLVSSMVEDVDQNTNLRNGSSLCANVPGVWLLSYTVTFAAGATGYLRLRITNSSVSTAYAYREFDASNILTQPIISVSAPIFIDGTSGASINSGYLAQVQSSAGATVSAHTNGGPTMGSIVMLRRL